MLNWDDGAVPLHPAVDVGNCKITGVNLGPGGSVQRQTRPERDSAVSCLCAPLPALTRGKCQHCTLASSAVYKI